MKQYIVDAFSDSLFSGNQAAVCVLDDWLPETLMQNIARENNFPETAFLVREDDDFHLRWFTPAGEIDFCGHATLASAFVIFSVYEKNAALIRFRTQAGLLTVQRQEDLFVMDLPSYKCNPLSVTEDMRAALGVLPAAAYFDRDLLMVLKTEEEVRNLSPDFEKMKKLPGLTIAVTAPGKDYDCVSRCFCPELKNSEDPVTGSTHCMITPYWCQRLQKKDLICYQASERGGILYTSQQGDRILISGKACLFAVADLNISI